MMYIPKIFPKLSCSSERSRVGFVRRSRAFETTLAYARSIARREMDLEDRLDIWSEDVGRKRRRRQGGLGIGMTEGPQASLSTPPLASSGSLGQAMKILGLQEPRDVSTRL
eukprot:scaffold733_cov267-Pinguiococcus_pyrenoidosus.AAC.52